MNKLAILFGGICILASCSTYSPKDDVEKAICEDFKSEHENYEIENIVKGDSINTVDIKDSIKTVLNKIDTCYKLINDSSAIDLLIPGTRAVYADLKLLLSEPDYVYRAYQLNTYNKAQEKINLYAHAEFKDGIVKRPISIDVSDDEPKMVEKFRGLQSNVYTVINNLENLCHKSPAEIAQMCKEAKQAQENARLAAEKARKEQEEANKPLSGWGDVAKIIAKRGKVIGIWKDNRQYGATVTIYQSGGSYYFTPVNYSKDPIGDYEVEQIFKKKNNTYMFNPNGGDMPEKYVINGRQLVSYVFNPDAPGLGGQWVYMGTYDKVY